MLINVYCLNCYDFIHKILLVGNPTEQETEKITALWQTSLMNNHINVDR